jgi:sugar O-acyltransferase (sialic acid O-acetyltransferase NeuD family)
MPTKLVLWGASDHAMVVADIVRLQGVYEIAGYLDDVQPDRAGQEFCGATILGGREQLSELKTRGIRHVLMAFGHNRQRLNLATLARSEGYELATAIHPRSVIAAGVSIGSGTVVMAGAVINPGVTIGENAIINTSAIVEHGCRIGDGARINPGSIVAGNVIIETGATIEIGAIVASRTRIGADAVVGAGALVLQDVPAGTLSYGIPARVVRSATQS